MITLKRTLRTKSNLLHASLWSGVLGMVVFPGKAHGASPAPEADGPPPKRAEAIPWSQLGARAGANYTGDGLSVTAATNGARLRCDFQKLEGQATSEGLWLTSTMTNGGSLSDGEDKAEGAKRDRVRVMAVAMGRGLGLTVPEKLPRTGTVRVANKLVRFFRPGLVEEYSVSMDGVRQDFVVTERPTLNSQPSTLNQSALRVELAVSGAKAEQLGDGVQLVLEKSGRKIAYSRLRVTDATGKKLPAWTEVTGKSEIRNPKSEMRLALVVEDSQAVYPIRIDPTFSDANWIGMGGTPGTDRGVTAVAVDGSGNLYIGGDFGLVGNVVANNIAKWDGNSWSALGSGLNNDVMALAVSGSDLYAGGFFTTAGGTEARYIAKWNGSSWSALGAGIADSGGGVFALAVSGSTVYAGGEFYEAGGVSAIHIAKWNGSSWSALGSGMDYRVYALAVAGNNVYAGGAFSQAGGSPANCIARWNGNSWSALGSGMEDPNFGTPEVHALAVSGTDLYAGGLFPMAGGKAATNIAKWNGSSWSPLGSGLGSQTHGSVEALAVSGSDLYAGIRYYSTGAGLTATNIAKWNGSSWSEVGLGTDDAVLALAVSGTNLYAGGGFRTAGETVANSIAKWNGSSWSALASGNNGDVFALAVSGGNLYVRGGFTTMGGVWATNIAEWNGSSWSPFGSEISGGVYAFAASGSNLYVGGTFTMAGGVSATNIAKWDGSSWSALGSGISGGSVGALAVSGSNVYALGRFTTVGGVSAPNIAKWDGSSWSALGSGFTLAPGIAGTVVALAVAGSDLYVGGWFTAADGVPANSIAKWNGNSWSALGSGMDGYVLALAVSGNDLYAGGSFRTAGGVPANRIARWDGNSWRALGSGMNGNVLALAVSGSDLYAGGEFGTAGESAAHYIAKWNGSSWSALGSGLNGIVFALAVSDSYLYAGGGFTTAGGKASAYMARAVLGDAPGYNQLGGSRLSGSAMQFSYIGYPATNYALDRAFNLTAPITWVGQETNAMTVSGVLLFTNTPAPGTNNFWRVRSVP